MFRSMLHVRVRERMPRLGGCRQTHEAVLAVVTKQPGRCWPVLRVRSVRDGRVGVGVKCASHTSTGGAQQRWFCTSRPVTWSLHFSTRVARWCPLKSAPTVTRVSMTDGTAARGTSDREDDRRCHGAGGGTRILGTGAVPTG